MLNQVLVNIRRMMQSGLHFLKQKVRALTRPITATLVVSAWQT
jgi:hypothetical protein